MSQSRVNRVAATIQSGQTTSNVLLAWQTYGSAAGIIIHSPSTLPETVFIEVSPDGINWNRLQDGSPLADVTVPSAGKSIYYDRLVLSFAVRLASSAAVAGNRTFNFTYQEVYD